MDFHAASSQEIFEDSDIATQDDEVPAMLGIVGSIPSGDSPRSNRSPLQRIRPQYPPSSSTPHPYHFTRFNSAAHNNTHNASRRSSHLVGFNSSLVSSIGVAPESLHAANQGDVEHPAGVPAMVRKFSALSIVSGGSTSMGFLDGPHENEATTPSIHRSSTRAQLRQWVHARQQRSGDVKQPSNTTKAARGGGKANGSDRRGSTSTSAGVSPTTKEPASLLPSLRKRVLPSIQSTAQYVAAIRESALPSMRAQLQGRNAGNYSSRSRTMDEEMSNMIPVVGSGEDSPESHNGVDAGFITRGHSSAAGDDNSSTSGASTNAPDPLAETFQETKLSTPENISGEYRVITPMDPVTGLSIPTAGRRGKPRGWNSLFGLRTVCTLIAGLTWIAAVLFVILEIPKLHSETARESYVKMLYHRAGSDALWIASSRLGSEKLSRLLRSLLLYEITDFKEVSFSEVPTSDLQAVFQTATTPTFARMNPRRLHPAFVTRLDTLSNTTVQEEWKAVLEEPKQYNNLLKVLIASASQIQSLPSSSFGQQFTNNDVVSLSSISFMFPANRNGIVWTMGTDPPVVHIHGVPNITGYSPTSEFVVSHVGASGAVGTKCASGHWGIENPFGLCFDLRAAAKSGATIHTTSLFSQDPMLRTLTSTMNTPNQSTGFTESSFLRSDLPIGDGAWDVPRRLGYTNASRGKEEIHNGHGSGVFVRLHLPLTVPMPPLANFTTLPNYTALNVSTATVIIVLEFFMSPTTNQFFTSVADGTRTVQRHIPHIPSLTTSDYLSYFNSRTATFLLMPSLLEGPTTDGHPTRRLMALSRTIDPDEDGNVIPMSALNASLTDPTTPFPLGHILEHHCPVSSFNSKISLSIESAIKQVPLDGLSTEKFWASQPFGLSDLECPTLFVVTPLVSPNPVRYFTGLGDAFPTIGNFTENDPRTMWATITAYECMAGQTYNFFQTNNFRLLISILAFLGVAIPLLMFIFLTLTVTTPLYRLISALSGYDSYASVDAAVEAATTGLFSKFYEVKKAQLVVVNAMFQMETILRVVELNHNDTRSVKKTLKSTGGGAGGLDNAQDGSPESTLARSVALHSGSIPTISLYKEDEGDTATKVLSATSDPASGGDGGGGERLRLPPDVLCYDDLLELDVEDGRQLLGGQTMPNVPSNSNMSINLEEPSSTDSQILDRQQVPSSLGGPSSPENSPQGQLRRLARQWGQPYASGRASPTLSTQITAVPGTCVVVAIQGDSEFIVTSATNPLLTGEIICRRCVELFGGIVGGAASTPLRDGRQRFILNCSFRSRDTCGDPEGSSVAAAMLIDYALGSSDTMCGQRAPGFRAYREATCKTTNITVGEEGEEEVYTEVDEAARLEALYILKALFSEEEFPELPGARVRRPSVQHILTFLALVARDPTQISVRPRGEAGPSGARGKHPPRPSDAPSPLDGGLSPRGSLSPHQTASPTMNSSVNDRTPLVYSPGQHGTVTALTKRYHPLAVQIAQDMYSSSSRESMFTSGRSYCLVVVGSDVAVGTTYTTSVFDYVGLICSRCSQSGKCIGCLYCGGERSEHFTVSLSSSIQGFATRQSDFGTGVDGTILLQLFAFKSRKYTKRSTLDAIRRINADHRASPSAVSANARTFARNKLIAKVDRISSVRRVLSQNTSTWSIALNQVTMKMLFGNSEEAALDAWSLALSPSEGCVDAHQTFLPPPLYIRLSAWRLALQCERHQSLMEQRVPSVECLVTSTHMLQISPNNFASSFSVGAGESTFRNPILFPVGEGSINPETQGSFGDPAFSIFYPAPDPLFPIRIEAADRSLTHSTSSAKKSIPNTGSTSDNLYVGIGEVMERSSRGASLASPPLASRGMGNSRDTIVIGARQRSRGSSPKPPTLVGGSATPNIRGSRSVSHLGNSFKRAKLMKNSTSTSFVKGASSSQGDPSLEYGLMD